MLRSVYIRCPHFHFGDRLRLRDLRVLPPLLVVQQHMRQCFLEKFEPPFREILAIVVEVIILATCDETPLYIRWRSKESARPRDFETELVVVG